MQHTFCNNLIDGLADTGQVFVDFRVGKADHLKPESIQMLCSGGVLHLNIGIIVLGTIQFNYQAGLSTVKIHNIAANRMLSPKLHRIPPKILIPQCVFLVCGIDSQAL